MLIHNSGNMEDLQRAIFDPSDKLNSVLSGVGETRNPLETDTHSTFVLTMPNLDSGESSPNGASRRSGSPEEQQHGDQETKTPCTETLIPSKISKANTTIKPRRRIPKTLNRSRHGIPYPSLLPGVTRKIATAFFRELGGKQTRMSKETLGAIIEAGDLYFRQLGGDLSAFANHAGRKKINESDVVAVMKR